MKKNFKFTVCVFTLLAVLVSGFYYGPLPLKAAETVTMTETAETGTVEAVDIVPTVNTSSVKACLDHYNSGVASLLDPTDLSNAGEIRLAETAKEPEYELVMTNVTNTLNVREEADTEALIVGKLYRDCGAVVLDRQEGWTKIKSGNLVGWAKDEYLFFGEAAEAEALRVGYSIAVVKSDAIRVREEANAEAASLGYAALNEELTVVSEVDEQWLCVEYGDGIGYVLCENVSKEFSVDHGETIDEITERKMKEEAEKNKLKKYYGAMSADEYELLLLSALIYCEAGSESYEGKIAVGAVVCNRVRNASYPDSLQGVIYASGQFSPAMNGKLDRVMVSGRIPQSCKDAAAEALGGYTNVGDSLYFRRNNGTREGVVIGNHVFY